MIGEHGFEVYVKYSMPAIPCARRLEGRLQSIYEAVGTEVVSER